MVVNPGRKTKYQEKNYANWKTPCIFQKKKKTTIQAATPWCSSAQAFEFRFPHFFWLYFQPCLKWIKKRSTQTPCFQTYCCSSFENANFNCTVFSVQRVYDRNFNLCFYNLPCMGEDHLKSCKWCLAILWLTVYTV